MNVDTIIERGGGVHDLAAKLKVSRTTILGWRKDGFIPGTRVSQISTELKIPATELLTLVQAPRPPKAA